MPISEIRTRRKVEFADTDMGGIVHFSRFFVYMESAEHELLGRLGTSVHFDYQGERVGWPRLSASCEYKAPARLDDVLDIHVRVVRKGRTSMVYSFTFTCGERLVAQGELASACCILGGERLRPIPIPEFLADQLAEADASEEGGGDVTR